MPLRTRRWTILLLSSAVAALFSLKSGAISTTQAMSFAVLQNSLGIPSEVAHITDASGIVPGTLPEFILIQDVHRHPEVQGHIASVVLQSYYRWGARKVFVEGAVSSVDLTMFHRVPTKTRNVLLERLVNDGDLTGAELAAVLILESEWSNPPVSPFQILGMEEAKLYRQNLQAFTDVQSQQERALYEIQKIRRLQAQLELGSANVLTQQLDRTEELVRLKLTPSEYESYLQYREAIPSSPQLDPMLRTAERFYKLVELRSHAFLEESQKKLPAGSGPRVLIVGGFHTPFMAADLRRAGKSYVVVTPHITQSGYEPLYVRRLQESISALQLPLPKSAGNPVH